MIVENGICQICFTPFVPDENGCCSYCEAEKRASAEFRAEHPECVTLTEVNYFSPEMSRYYMGTSQFKSFAKCEDGTLAELNGKCTREMSTALLVGSYVDAHFSGTLDLFKAQHPEIISSTGKTAGQLKTDYQHANYIIERIERDPAFMEAMSGGTQAIMTGEIEGVPVKIKVDSLRPDRIVDMKIMRDMDDIYDKELCEWQPFWKAWGYDIQGAIYQEIVRQNIGLLLPFGLAVATKEKPEPDIALIELPQATLNEALGLVRANIVYYDGLKKGLYEPERCGKCDYCRSTKILTGWEKLINA